MKKVAGSLRLDLSQFRELEAFAKFGSELDQETQKALARGERLVESLNQPQFVPWPVQDQVMIIFAATQGYADDVSVAEISHFNTGLRTYLNQQFPGIGDDIAATKDLGKDTEAKLRSAITGFKEVWFADRGES
jgi:F-type H+-transporting ATPase subunit alpha